MTEHGLPLPGYVELLRADAAAVLDDDIDDGEMDRLLVDRVKSFLGHVEDMPENERVFLLGALCGALERRLGRGG